MGVSNCQFRSFNLSYKAILNVQRFKLLNIQQLNVWNSITVSCLNSFPPLHVVHTSEIKFLTLDIFERLNT